MTHSTLIPPCYTGVGSRETPPEILQAMQRLAARLAAAGWTLRSGGADGADDAFEQGCDQTAGTKEIYLPWKGFNRRSSMLFGVDADALQLAATVHPAWADLKQGVRKLHARNCYQVLGGSLDRPSAFLVCWTPDGCEHESTRTRQTGGTATAIVLASRHGVPVFNMRHAHRRHQLVEHLAGRGLTLPPPEGYVAPPAQPTLFGNA